jgi:preprotein translocase subunit SecB
MASLPLLSYRVTDLSFHNALKDPAHIQISLQMGYHLQHLPAGAMRGEMKMTLSDRNDPDAFTVKATLVGIFRAPDTMEREAAHKESFRVLFPYLRALVSTVTANAGIPAILLPPVDPDEKSITKVEFHPEGRPAEDTPAQE